MNEYDIELAGQIVQLAPTLEAMKKIEGLTGIGIYALLRAAAQSDCTVDQVTAIIYAGRVAAGERKLKRSENDEQCFQHGIDKCLGEIGVEFLYRLMNAGGSMPEDDGEQEKKA